jgi:glyoxylase-like metal-dependent hydrolase (beta-lactamase superfamily II)
MPTVRTRVAGTAAEIIRAPVPELPQLHQIILPTPWDVGPVQVYGIEGDPFTLIDTGVKTPESWAALGGALEALGSGLEDVGRVILTHYHGDHLGQVQSLRDAGADLVVWAHEAEAPMIEGFSPERDERIEETRDLFREYGVPEDLLERQETRLRAHLREAPALCEATRVDQLVRDGDAIPFKDFELRVIHAPGHTAGHLLLHEPRSGVLVTGDHLMGSAVPYTDNYYAEGGADPGDPLRRRPRFKGLPRYLESLRTLRRQVFSTILPAHGGVVVRPDRAIEDAILFYEVRIQRIERGLRTLAAMGQEVTAWDIWKALFPKADPVSEMRTRMLMVIGAIDVLERNGTCVTTRRSDGVLVHNHL